MKILRKWRKKKRVRYIPLELIFETLYERLKSFNEEIPILPEIHKNTFLKRKKIPRKKKKITIEPRETILYKSSIRPSNSIKILLVWPSNIREIMIISSKKSNLLRNWRLDRAFNAQIKNVEYKPKKYVTLNIWDMVIPSKFESFRDLFYKGTAGVVLILDLTKEETLIQIKNQYREIKKKIGKIPFILIGVKLHLRVVLDRKKAEEFVISEGGIYIEIEDASMYNVDDAILELTHKILTQETSRKIEIQNIAEKPADISVHKGGFYDATFKIILFGDNGCGKETLTQRFLTNIFVSDQTMTIGVDFEVKTLTVDGQRVKLQVWDFGGEERFKFLLPTYVRGARGGIFIYDITNYSSLAHIDDWLSVIRKEIREEDIFPIIVVGNRANLVNDREVSSADAIKIAKSRGVNGFIEISAKTGENVEKTFEALTRLMFDEMR